MPLMEEINGPAKAVTHAYPWFAVRTKINHERIAASLLSSKGLESYLPTRRTRRQWSDRVVHSESPLFPGYLFCRFDPMKKLAVIETPSVTSIVSFGNQLAPVDDSEITAIQMILDSGLQAEVCPYPREGERVRVISGSLEGLEGILLRRKSEFRMVVSISLLQRSIAVEVDRAWIEAL